MSPLHLYIAKGAHRFETDPKEFSPTPIARQWLTSPWLHIEPAMAYQIGLPVLLFRQEGVIADGILERGTLGLYMPEFDLEKPLDDYVASAEWNGILGKWEGCVRAVVEKKGTPPKLF
jgi:hypothetical protein